MCGYYFKFFKDIFNHNYHFAAQLQEAELRMKGHMTAMEAPLYQSYQVYVLHPLRAKTEIHLGNFIPSVICSSCSK